MVAEKGQPPVAQKAAWQYKRSAIQFYVTLKEDKSTSYNSKNSYFIHSEVSLQIH